MKVRIPKSVRNTLISIVVLLMIFVGGGVAYTWYMGQNTEDVLSVTTPVETPSIAPRAPKSVKPAANAPASASVQTLTTPVAPGWNASFTVKTNPEADCTVTVTYDEVASADSGLGPKVADEYGLVSWTWTVDETAPIGEWPVEATCTTVAGKSAVVRGMLDVVMEQEQD